MFLLLILLSAVSCVLSINVTSGVKFYLYTETNTSLRQQLKINDTSSVLLSNFDSFKDTKIVVHGYLQNSNTKEIIAIKNAFLSKGDFNVLLVDYGVITFLDYVNAFLYIDDVGLLLGKEIEFLVATTGITTKSIEIVGFSFGAQVAAYAAQSLSSGKIGTIVGLDVALPGYVGLPANKRLSFDDADYVYCIHTNGGEYGTLSAIGHADFYPNYGKQQPGCIPILGNIIGCSHGRSLELFTESLTEPINFLAKPCSSEWWLIYLNFCVPSAQTNVVMGGEPLDTTARGVYYLKTNSKSPFALG